MPAARRLNAEGAQPRGERRRANPKELCGATGAVSHPAAALERGDEVRVFAPPSLRIGFDRTGGRPLEHSFRLWLGGDAARAMPRVRQRRVALKPVAARQDRGVLDHVRELPHVAGQVYCSSRCTSIGNTASR
jgi:hypothetical protein